MAEQKLSSRQTKQEALADNVTISNHATDDVFWFVQVSDLHLSAFPGSGGSARLADLREFTCGLLARVIRPTVVVVSGDLTDAKLADAIGSKQNEKEWQMYESIVAGCGGEVERRFAWLDIRGNHDSFDVRDERANQFARYSARGRRRHGSGSYVHELTHAGKRYAFVGIDAVPMPGLKRPFNFFGVITGDAMADVEVMAAKATRDNDYVFFFGHYPTSTIFSHVQRLRNAMRGGIAYLCGHLHILLGLAERLYTRHTNGLLELELGDWKDNRLFRLVAVDQGLVSFADVDYRQRREGPIVLVTNPKDPRFVIPWKEPLQRMATSTHVRALVFTSEAVESVSVRFDGDVGTDADCSAVGAGPVYAAPWNPDDYATGLHTLRVTVTFKTRRSKDQRFATTEDTFLFSLDGSRPGGWPDLWRRMLLMSQWPPVQRFVFGAAVAAIVVPLCAAKLVHHAVAADKLRRPHRLMYCVSPRSCRCSWKLLRKLALVASIDKLFFPITISAVWLALGPWAFGYFLSDRVGLLFAWGLFIDGGFLPADSTYLWGFFQVVLNQIPLLLFTLNAVDRSFRTMNENEPDLPTFRPYLFRHSGFVALVLTQVIQAYFFYAAYGFLSVCGPLRLGQLAVTIYLGNTAVYLRVEDFAPALKLAARERRTTHATSFISSSH